MHDGWGRGEDVSSSRPVPKWVTTLIVVTAAVLTIATLVSFGVHLMLGGTP